MRHRFLAFLVAAAGPAADGADAIWRFESLDEIGGTRVTILGEPCLQPTPHGQAAEFDGADDGLVVHSIPIAGAKAFTIELLFRPDEGGLKEQRYLHVLDRAQRRALLELRADGKGGWWLDGFLRIPSNEGLVLIDSTRVHPTGRWYWVALRYDGERLASFVNGAKECEGRIDSEPFGDGSISLGTRQTRVSWFKGAIAEVRFHRNAIRDEGLQRIGRR